MYFIVRFQERLKGLIMRKISLILFLVFSLIQISCQGKGKKMKNILLFSKTVEFRHDSIEPAIDAIKNLGSKNNFKVFHTEDGSYFEMEKLKNYHAIIFLNTSGDVLNDDQQIHFKNYIQDGGGWVGIHCATDTETDWSWYGNLAGAYFNGHPEIQEAKLMVVDNSHLSTTMLPDTWIRTDEWYNFKNINKDINTLIKIDEDSYKGGTNGINHPIAWYHNFDGGRIFYTALGHTNESYSEKLFLDHLLGGIKWASGENHQK